MRKFLAFVLCVFFLTMMFSPHTTPAVTAEEMSPIQVAVSYGYDNFAKASRHLPIRLGYSSRMEEDFVGQVKFMLNESDGEVYEYGFPVVIPAGGDRYIEYAIPLGLYTDTLYIYLSAENGETVWSRNVNLNMNTETARLMVGVLSDMPGELDYFDDVSIRHNLLKSKLVYLHAASFPQDVRMLDQLDVILISNYRIRDLSLNQSRTLMEWVKGGGVMILGTGERVDDTLGRFAPELLDDMYEDARSADIDLMAGMEGTEESIPVSGISVVNFELHGGSLLSVDGNIKLLSAVKKGRGVIVAAAYDFTKVAAYGRKNKIFGENILSLSLGDERINRISGESYGISFDRYMDMAVIVNSGDSGILPPMRLYGIVLLFYVALIGPLLYFLLRRHLLVGYYRMAAASLAVVFAALIYYMGGTTRFEDTFYQYIRIVDAGEESVSETIFVNLRNPYNRPYEVSPDDSYFIFPITSPSLSYISDQKSIYEGNANIRMYFDESDSKIYVEDVGVFNPRFFKMDKYGENSEGIGFYGTVSLFDGVLSGRIKNNYNRNFNTVILLLYGKLAILGSVQEGEEVDLSEVPLYNIPLNSFEELASFITGLDKGGTDDVDDETLRRQILKKNMLSYYMYDVSASYLSDGIIIAFSDHEDHQGIFNNTMQNRGLDIYTASLSVSNKEDDLIYRNLLIKPPVVLSGEYYPSINSMYPNEPLVIEYSVGTDLSIREFRLEEVSESLTAHSAFIGAFSGTVSFYNWEREAFERVSLLQKSFAQDMLEPYISQDHSIRVRYSYDNNLPQHWSVALPMPHVIGRIQ